MEDRINVKPLPFRSRQRTFGFLIIVFLAVLPFLYLYATGYRFDLEKPTNLVSTGGMYVAVDKTGAEIFIDGELVRETRTFRKAFYAQNLDAGTHRVHVQKEGYHTWVKELPVSKRLVTEAEAFNLPLVPQVRVISEWLSATGTMVVKELPTHASSTNALLATTTKNTKAFSVNNEYKILLLQFGTTSTSTQKLAPAQQLRGLLQGGATTTQEMVEEATTTIVSGGVRLYEQGEDLYATWIGSFEQMPYYYCAPDFPAYSTSTATTSNVILNEKMAIVEVATLLEKEEGIMHPIQSIPVNTACDPAIRIDRKWQQIKDFDFFPGSTDFVLVVLQDGIYVVEIDDRGWQNVQPLMIGNNLRMHIENRNIFVHDGILIYQVVLQTE